MRLLMGLALIFSFNTFATDWNSLEIGQTYNLKQNFSLPQLERSGSSLDFTQGEKATLMDIIPLDTIKVMLYQFKYHNCPALEMRTDMEIIPVQGTTPVVEVGAELERFCMLNIYFESKDFMSESLFE